MGRLDAGVGFGDLDKGELALGILDDGVGVRISGLEKWDCRCSTTSRNACVPVSMACTHISTYVSQHVLHLLHI